MGKNKYGICTSSETVTKQENFGGLLEILMPVAKKKISNWTWCDPSFWIYDLNAARSEYPDDSTGNLIVGSAVRGVEMARSYGLKYQAVFCELDEDNAEDLRNYFADDSNVTVLQGNNEDTLPPILSSVTNKPRFGYVYVDPNDAKLPINLLKNIFSRPAFRRTDLIVNVAAASVKRMIHNENYGDISLEALLGRINKTTWLVREPHGKHQWSLIVGTNWADAPEWKNGGFFRLDTTDGRRVWKKLSKTQKQQMEDMQPNFFK